MVVVRDYDPKNDCRAVEEVERICEVGPGGKLSIFTDLLGDPICRVRNSPAYQMLVAEVVVQKDGGEWREIVGMIRGCVKTVTCGKKISRNGKSSLPLPVYAKVAYILGLRVSPFHRRMGIGLKLVTKMEEWFRENGAEYSYMATENDNQASINLFTHKCGYSKFRKPSILVQPVFAHRVSVSSRVTIIKLCPGDAEVLYRSRFSTTEFFPRDIDSILRNSLSLGTFLAVPKGRYTAETWRGAEEFLAAPPESWAVLSVWNSMEVFKLEVRGASRKLRGFAKTTRALDRAFPWLHLPSVPEVFRPFGLHFLYGLGGEGPLSVKFITALCGFAHNLAKERGCGVVATEVSAADPLSLGIPHWKRLSCADDLWCIKRLGEDYSDGSVGDWTKSQPGLSRQCIKYLGPKEREAYRVIVEEGKLVYKESGSLLNTEEGSKWIFVLSTARALYVGQKKKGVFQHSSFLSGGATTAAGRLVAHDGILEAIWPYSGHYLPTEDNFKEFISFLEEHNVDLTNVKRCAVDDDRPSLIGSGSKKETAESESTHVGKETPSEEVSKPAVSQETAKPRKARPPPVFDLGKRLSCKWASGVGARIGCVRDYPLDLQSQALEKVNLSPRVNAPHQPKDYNLQPIPSPRPSPKIRLSPRLAYMGLPSPRHFSAQ